MRKRKVEIEAYVSPYNRQLDCTNLTFYDSTLRDGEQMAGLSFTPEQKLEIARMLDEMQVPQIEVGFPACSETERKAIKKIVSEKLDAKILCLSRIVKEDLDHAIDCGVDTALLFVSCSDIQILNSHVKKEEIAKKVEFSVEYLKKHGIKPSFSTMDSTRGDISLQIELFGIALRAGARRLGITDTLGCISPDSFQILVSKIKEKINSFGYGQVGKEIELSVHCHNDFGLALANAISGIQAGATAVATTTMGIGERAGNVPTEQFVMAMKYLYGIDLGIKTEYFSKLAKKIARFAKLKIPPNAPFVGSNAFAHESGIHVQSVLSQPFSFEPVSPEVVGNRRKIILGKHSGTAGLKFALSRIGLELSDDVMKKVLEEVKKQGEKKGKVSYKDLIKICKEVS